MVGALDLNSGGPGFKSFSLPPVCLKIPGSTPPRFVNSPLDSLSPEGIFYIFLFNLQYLFAHFSVLN